MSESRYRLPAAIALTLGLAVLSFVLILTAVYAVGTDGQRYFTEQMRSGILPQAGISENDLRQLDAQLSDYLRVSDRREGHDDDPQFYLPEAGHTAFNDRETAHLKDCRGLFKLLYRVRARLIPWAVLLIAGGAYMLRDRRRIRLCACLSPLILLIPLGAFALYAAFDFDAAFTLFHRLMFRNDLWLLDPRTDLLIRICPERMFMAMGISIGVYGLIGILAVSAVAALLTFIWPKGKEDNTWKTTTRRGPAPKRITFGNRGAR